MKRLIIAAVLLIATLAFSQAASVPPGVTDPKVFNAQDYLNSYADLGSGYGTTNIAAAREHWTNWGLAQEGRRASLIFDPQYYLQNNPDLASQFGAKGYPAALQHFLTHGLAEGRRGSLEFDPKYYLANNPDLLAALGKTGYAAAADHFFQTGLPQEGRQGSADFSVKAYMNMYPDIMAAYGPSGYREAIWHWLRRGRAQGRKGIGVPEISSECSGATRPGFSRIFIALRTDGHPGSGTARDPLDGSTPQKFDTVLRARSEAKQQNLIVCIGPGTFKTEGNFDFATNMPRPIARGFSINKNWKIHGAGMDKTILQLVTFIPNSLNMPAGTATGVVFSTHDDGSSGIEISDLTIDNNYSELKAAATRQGITALNLDAMHLRSDQGGHWVHRVNIVNSAGEINETFPVQIFSVSPRVRSENDIVEYVTMSGWGAGVCAAIALANATGEVRYNVVRDYEKAYGVWAADSISFHDNYAINNQGYGFNIDSLDNSRITIEFNQVIHPKLYAMVLGGKGKFADFQVNYNTIVLNSNSAMGIILQGNVTNAHITGNSITTDHPSPRNIQAMVIRNSGNQNNTYQSNYVRMGAVQYDVRPNSTYSLPK
ncbi:MAG: hypothetical protein DMG65_21920 [Candidatus Angelobacter sp. Gp1-AA117]|nr:MAG: hypothetical protein DMG65_21920 [Candidatus Angelobacter sp. Gp1-AA117]